MSEEKNKESESVSINNFFGFKSKSESKKCLLGGESESSSKELHYSYTDYQSLSDSENGRSKIGKLKFPGMLTDECNLINMPIIEFEIDTFRGYRRRNFIIPYVGPGPTMESELYKAMDRVLEESDKLGEVKEMINTKLRLFNFKEDSPVDYFMRELRKIHIFESLKGWNICHVSFLEDATEEEMRIVNSYFLRPIQIYKKFLFVSFMKTHESVTEGFEDDCISLMTPRQKFLSIMIFWQIISTSMYVMLSITGHKLQDARLKFTDPLLFMLYITVFQYSSKYFEYETSRKERGLITLWQCICCGVTVYFFDKYTMDTNLTIVTQVVGAITMLMMINLYFEKIILSPFTHFLISIKHSIPIAILTIISFVFKGNESVSHTEVLASSLFIWMWYSIYETMLHELFFRLKDKNKADKYSFIINIFLLIFTAVEEIVIALYHDSYPIILNTFGIGKRFFIIIVLFWYQHIRKNSKHYGIVHV